MRPSQDSLHAWVDELLIRFPTIAPVPACWWRHIELVEAFSALRAYERECYSETASLRGPVEWHRAFADLEDRWQVWIKRFRCGRDRFPR